MAKYLDSVLKILPAVQARQLTDLLNELKVSGEVRNADEYQIKLKELASLVNSTEPKPSFQQIRALVWNFATSDAHNAMMKALQNDIEALFQQVNEIGNKTDDHHLLVMKNLFADMERGLDDQENNIRRLEWLAGKNNEFSLAIVNSFKSASLNRVSRSTIGAGTLYFDNRTYKNKTVAELPNAIVSENGQKLLLGTSNEAPVRPLSVRLLTDASSYGTKIQSEVDNQIENIIDGENGTFWTRDVYLYEAVGKVTTVLQFDLGNAKDVDYVIVQGATDAPFWIDKIEGVAVDGSLISLKEEEVEVPRNTRIDFQKTFLKGIKITFSTRTYNRAEYFVDKKSPVIKVLQPKDKFNEVERAQSLGPLATEVLSSQNLADILNIPPGESQQVNSFLYLFALDNVWFGNSLYNDSGIFVSKPLKGNDFGIVAVQANENIATDSPNSIEYEIIKRDLSPKYVETKFPIPYLEQTSVVSERLILTKREENSTISDAGSLRFCPYVASDIDFALEKPITVYENGQVMTVGSYQIAIALAPDGTSLNWETGFTDEMREFSNYTLNPTKMWIKIVAVKSNAVYTVDYTIRTSDTHVDDKTVYLDKGRTIFLSEGGRVNFIRENSDVTIESEIYLQVTLRRNAASRETSPELNEYAILGATYNG